MIRATPSFIAFALLFWCGAPAQADAQTVFGQPASGPAGAGTTDRTSAVLTMRVDQAADENDQIRTTSSTIDQHFQGLRFFSSARADAAVGKAGGRYGWQLSGGSALRYYPGLQQAIRSRDTLAGAATFPVGRRLSVQGSASVSHSPYYSLAPAFSAAGTDPTLIDPTAIDYSVIRQTTYTWATQTGLSYTLGQHSSFTLSGGSQRTTFRQQGPSLIGWNAQSRFSHRFTQNTGFHLGYGRHVGEFALVSGPSRAEIENIDAGIDYRRALSFSRNTTIGVSSGMARTMDVSQRQSIVTVTGTVDRLIGRTGHLGLQYDRGVRLVEGLVRPLFVDTMSLNVGTGLSQRIGFGATGGYSSGEIGIVAGGASNGYHGYNGSANLSFDVSSRTSLNVDYLVYHHDFGSDVQLLGLMASAQRRQTLRVSLTLRFPLTGELPIKRR